MINYCGKIYVTVDTEHGEIIRTILQLVHTQNLLLHLLLLTHLVDYCPDIEISSVTERVSLSLALLV
jgi:hypothetical protein